MTFKELGFVVVKNIYDVENHTILNPDLFEYTKDLEDGAEDPQVPGAPSFYKDLEMCKVQVKIHNAMEENTGLKLYPTYNYFRNYNSKSILVSHRDRPACEISVTMNIGFEGDYNWPIWITGNDGKDYSVVLEPGDGLIYRGCERPHWREDADERVIFQSQVFLHYVNQDGPYSNCIYDINKS